MSTELLNIVTITHEGAYYAIGPFSDPGVRSEIVTELFAELENSIKDKELGREYTISLKPMTRTEFENLPEFEGF